MSKEKGAKAPSEMAISIGDKPEILGREWTAPSFFMQLGIDLMGREFGLESKVWQEMLARFAFYITNNLETLMDSLETSMVEQLTAKKLREKFGEPLSDLALPVYALLAKMEVEAQTQAKMNAIQVEFFWNNMKSNVIHMMGLFLAAEINKVEQNEQAHKAALANAEQETVDPALKTVKTRIQDRFKNSLENLKSQKSALSGVLEAMANKIVAPIQRSFSVTVFETARQQVSPTPVGN